MILTAIGSHWEGLAGFNLDVIRLMSQKNHFGGWIKEEFMVNDGRPMRALFIV